MTPLLFVCIIIIIINGFLCSVLLLHMQLQYLVERRSKINGFV